MNASARTATRANYLGVTRFCAAHYRERLKSALLLSGTSAGNRGTVARLLPDAQRHSWPSVIVRKLRGNCRGASPWRPLPLMVRTVSPVSSILPRS